MLTPTSGPGSAVTDIMMKQDRKWSSVRGEGLLGVSLPWGGGVASHSGGGVSAVARALRLAMAVFQFGPTQWPSDIVSEAISHSGLTVPHPLPPHPCPYPGSFIQVLLGLCFPVFFWKIYV